MSTVVFVSHNKPDKKLISEYVYKYHPDSELREKIISEVRKHLQEYVVTDDMIEELNIEVKFKSYDSKNS